MEDFEHDDDSAPPPAYTSAPVYPRFPITPGSRRKIPNPRVDSANAPDLSDHIRGLSTRTSDSCTTSSPETSAGASSTHDGNASFLSVGGGSSIPRYLYYRVFSPDGAIKSKTSFSEDDPYTGRVVASLITPPITAKSIKRFLCKQEKVSASAVGHIGLFASTLTSESELSDEDRPRVLTQDGPGSVMEDPMALIIKDSPPTVSDRPVQVVRVLSATSPLSRSPPKPFSSKALQLRKHKKCVSSVAFSLDGTQIVSGAEDKTICVWDVARGQLSTGPIPVNAVVLSVAFSPDGRIVSGCQSHPYIRIWDARIGIPVSHTRMFEGHTKSVNSVAFSPDGQRIATGSSDMTIRIWDARLGIGLTDPLEGHTDAVTSIAFSPDGLRIASGSSDATIRVWDIKTAALVAGPLRGHTAKIQSVAFCPKGRWLVSSSNDRDVRAWDTKVGTSRTSTPTMVSRRFTGHTNWVMSVAVSKDGRWIISASRGVVLIWNFETGEIVAALAPPKSQAKESWVLSTAISSKGDRIVAGTHGGSLYMWSRK